MSDDILEALLASNDGGREEGFRTRREILAALEHGGTPIGKATLEKRLREFFDAGRLESRKVLYTRVDGQLTTVPAYRLRKDDA